MFSEANTLFDGFPDLAIRDKMVYFSSCQLHDSAIFLGRRLVAQYSVNKSQDNFWRSLLLLCRALVSANSQSNVYYLLQPHFDPTPGVVQSTDRYPHAPDALAMELHYHFAKAAFERKLYTVVFKSLLPAWVTDLSNLGNLEPSLLREMVPGGNAGLLLLGKTFCKSQQLKNAATFFNACARADPLLWEAFEGMYLIGADLDNTEIVTEVRTENTPSTISTPGNMPGVFMMFPDEKQRNFSSIHTPSPIRSHRTSVPAAPNKASRVRGAPAFLDKPRARCGYATPPSIVNSTVTPVARKTGTDKTKKVIQAPQSSAQIEKLFPSLMEVYKAVCMRDTKEVIKLCNNLPERHRSSLWVHEQVGRTKYDSGDFEGAKKAFEYIRKRDPSYMPGMEIYSTVLWQLRMPVELSHLAADLIDINKLAPQAWCAAGNSSSLQKDHKKAIRLFRRAIQLDGSMAYAHALCGYELMETDSHDLAIAAFRNALKVDYRHYNAWNGLGMVLLAMHNRSQALHHFVQAVHHHPQSSVLRCTVGLVMLAKDESESALENLEIAIELDDKNAIAILGKAKALVALRRFDEALVILRKLLEVTPSEVEVHRLLAVVYQAKDAFNEQLYHLEVMEELENKDGEQRGLSAMLNNLLNE